MFLRNWLLYWQTIKRLTFGQLWWRFRYTIKRKIVEKYGQKEFDRMVRNVGRLVDEAGFRNLTHVPGTEHRYYHADIEKLLENEFTFLNERIRFGENVEWHRPEFSRGTRLWKLTINYHEYLVDVANKWKIEGKDSRWGKWFGAHVKEWMRQNPLGTKGYGFDNWNSYALSLRIVSWIRVYAIAGFFFSADFRQEFLVWLAVQSRFLGENIEYDILGNHIVKNWKALMWAGTFFKDEWMLEKGRAIFRRFVKPQFTKAGMHEELSPMYAAIVLADIRDVMEFTGDVDGTITGMEKKLAGCLGYLSFGNDWARFNDSCAGMAPAPENFGKNRGFFVFDGYVGGCYEEWQWMADCGAPAMGRQPGHAHCDALSFEYGRNGEKIFTNAGVYEYNPGKRRVYSRSSTAHNTLSVSGHEQHEIWKAFRCGRLGTARNLRWRHGETADTWSGEFVSFDKSYTHKRKMELSRRAIVCEDEVSAREDVSGVLNFHLMPEFRAKDGGEKILICRCHSDEAVATIRCEGGRTSVIKMPYFPEYGKEVESDVVSIDIARGLKVKVEIEFA